MTNHIIAESFQAINRTDIESQTHNNQEKYNKN